jgi:putative inorganic carbon (HCO3(-)) transporter
VFLQTALDVGLPGLIAYLALLLVATALCWRLYRHGGKVEASLAVGLWASLAATHLFGLTDAIALGAKVGVFLWWNLALIGALGGAEDWRPTPLTEPARQDHLGDGN